MKILTFQPKRINPNFFGFFCASILYFLLFFTLLYVRENNVSVQENGNQIITLKLTKSSPKKKAKQKPKQRPIAKTRVPKEKVRQPVVETPIKKVEEVKEEVKEEIVEEVKEEEIKEEIKEEISEEEVTQKNTPETTQAEQEIESLAYNQGVTDDFLSKIRLAISNNNPYPRIARMRRLEGNVIVEFILNIDGSLEGLKILQSTANALLNTTALKAVSNASKFFPTPKHKVRIKVPISYHLTRK